MKTGEQFPNIFEVIEEMRVKHLKIADENHSTVQFTANIAAATALGQLAAELEDKVSGSWNQVQSDAVQAADNRRQAQIATQAESITRLVNKHLEIKTLVKKTLSSEVGEGIFGSREVFVELLEILDRPRDGA